MVIGGDLAWEYILNTLSFEGQSNVMTHKLGLFWLSSGVDDQHFSSQDWLTACQPPMSNEASLSKVRLTPDDRKYDMQKLEIDPLHCSPHDNRLAMSISDEKVLVDYKKTVKLVKLENGENHIEFSLPWACDPVIAPNNYAQAKRAILSLQRKLADKPELRSQYCNKIDTAIKEGHLIRISNEELSKDLNDVNKQQYYIPHFNTSQSKFRVVYDAAREYQGMSLNKLLNRGPIFMQSLRSILIRFGERQYGIAGDIKNMFFQIRIAAKDRDMLRILWFSDPDMKGSIAAYQFQVAPYGLRCIPSMAGYAMVFTADNNIPNVSNEAVSRVTRDMFVDDLITGVDSIENGRQLIKEVSLLLASTGLSCSIYS